MKNNVELLIDGNRGIYVPQEFAKRFNPSNSHWEWDESIKEDLSNPDNENYWEAWSDLIESAYYLNEGVKYTLFEYEGDLFAIKEGHQFGEDLE